MGSWKEAAMEGSEPMSRMAGSMSPSCGLTRSSQSILRRYLVSAGFWITLHPRVAHGHFCVVGGAQVVSRHPSRAGLAPRSPNG